MITYNNLYRMSTATSISNSGTGTNALTKPAGTEVASIVPGKKWSVYIPSSASFTTDFNADGGEFTISLYSKPEPGIFMTVATHTVSYTGHSFVLTNEILDRVEIAVDSHRAHFVSVSFSAMEVGLSVDGVGDSIPSNVVELPGTMLVTLLDAGGILDNVSAKIGLLSTAELAGIVEEFNTWPLYPDNVAFMADTIRDWAITTRYPDISLTQGQDQRIPLPSSDALSFKVDYSLVGDATVAVNGAAVPSGTAFIATPENIHVFASTDCSVKDILVTEYYGNELGVSPFATFSTDGGSGNFRPVHKHDDNMGTTHDTDVVLKESVNTLSGWFYAQNGSPLPGVTMNNGVLTGTNLYVNGKAYVGETVVRDWYFLTRTAATSGSFTTTVPVSHYHFTTDTYTAAQIDDLYENFFGNVTLTAAQESISLVEQPALVVSSEWSIVSSG